MGDGKGVDVVFWIESLLGLKVPIPFAEVVGVGLVGTRKTFGIFP